MDDLFARLAGPGLAQGPVMGPFGGQSVEVWLYQGEPAVAVLVEGDRDDLEGLHRIAWSLGCGVALAPGRTHAVLIRTDGPPGPPAVPREPGPGHIDPVPAAVPGVVRCLARLAERWRERLLRHSLADPRDWTEPALNRAVEAPIVGLLLGDPGRDDAAARMRAELDTAGIVLDAVPPGLLALAWDLHLARGVRLTGADASIAARPPPDRAGPDRLVLRRFAAWACEGLRTSGRILVPVCGAGRLLLACGALAVARSLHLYALDPDPRAVLFAEKVVGRAFGDIDCTVRAAHPLVGVDLYRDPLARLIPADAQARLNPVDWRALFGGVDRFDRVLIADPAVPLSRRTAVRRYVEGAYATAGTATGPALLLVEAGARRLETAGRVLALFRTGAWRSPYAALVRRWLAPRVDAFAVSSGYCAVSAAAEPLPTPIVVGLLDEGGGEERYPRHALDAATWTVTDPARAALVARLKEGATPLGDLLLGGVRASGAGAPDPRLILDAGGRRHLLRADRRAGTVIRPVVTPADVVRYGSVRRVPRFLIAGPLPPGAQRAARELGVEPPHTDPFPPPAGPRLLFAEGSAAHAYLFDPRGRAVPSPGVGTIGPADLLLVGLLHSSPVAILVAEYCAGGLSARSLARLPVRLPDPYDDRERRLGEEIAALVGKRMDLADRRDPGAEDGRGDLEGRIDRAVRELYGTALL